MEAGAAARVPRIGADPAWTIEEDGEDSPRHRVAEALLTVGAGGLATRGSVEEAPWGSVPMVLASGVYIGSGPEQHLLTGPDWTGLAIDPPPVSDRHVLDLRAGLLSREEAGPGRPLRTVRFASIRRPGVVVMRAEAAPGRLCPGPALRQPPEGTIRRGDLDGRTWMRVSDGSTGPGITAVAAQRVSGGRGGDVVDRVCVYRAGEHGPPEPWRLLPDLAEAWELGVDRLLAEQREAWARRWEKVNVCIPADPPAELAFRFALFQLWGNVGGSTEAAVGARGLSGGGYAGHVFWDADVFVLPAMASIEPPAARAMLEYRTRRLPAARAAAGAAGRRGARFPWESASDGVDVTPTRGDLGGREVDIRTGQLEEHITADVAWAGRWYASWTGDTRFLAGQGGELLVECARYWASRCELDADGRAHIGPVIGPDEYHESVMDNAFTNVMARWNLRAAAAHREASTSADAESRRWRSLASALVDGYRPETGRYEQFAGYFGLEPLLVEDLATPPVAANVLLGQERVASSQLIKQPDVLMLHHLVPDEVAPGSLAPNLDFYGPRTAHGSSLSPAISAALLAKAGRVDEALALLRTALRLDLDDLTGLTASGLHLATLAGVWQALLFGFVGARTWNGVLHLDPRLPSAWPSIELRFRCLGRLVRLSVTEDRVRVDVDGPLRVRLAGHATRRVVHTARFVRRKAA